MCIACKLQGDMIPLCIYIPAFLLHSEIYFLDVIFLLETISKLQQESEIPHVINNTPSIWALTFRAKNTPDKYNLPITIHFLYRDMNYGMICLSHGAQLPILNRPIGSQHFMNQAIFHSTFPILVITKNFALN